MNITIFLGITTLTLNVIAYSLAFYAIYQVKDYKQSFEHLFFMIGVLLTLGVSGTENWLFLAQVTSLDLALHEEYNVIYKYSILIGILGFGFLAFRASAIVDYHQNLLILTAGLTGILFADLLLMFQIRITSNGVSLFYIEKQGALLAAVTSFLLLSIPFGLELYTMMNQQDNHLPLYRKVMLYELLGHGFLALSFVILSILRTTVHHVLPFSFFLFPWALGLIILSIGIIHVPLPYRIFVPGKMTFVAVFSQEERKLVTVYQTTASTSIQSQQQEEATTKRGLGIVGVFYLINDILQRKDKKDAELIATSLVSNIIIVPYKSFIGSIQIEKKNMRFARYILRQILLYLESHDIHDPDEITHVIKQFIGIFLTAHQKTIAAVQKI